MFYLGNPVNIHVFQDLITEAIANIKLPHFVKNIDAQILPLDKIGSEGTINLLVTFQIYLDNRGKRTIGAGEESRLDDFIQHKLIPKLKKLTPKSDDEILREL